MKNSFHTFKQLNSGLSIPFALANLTAAVPITKEPTGGTMLYGVGIPGGIAVQEPVEAVIGLYNTWFKDNAVGLAGRA